MSRRTLLPLIIASVLLLLSLGAYALTFRAVNALQEESFLLQEEITAAKDREVRIARAERTLALIREQEEAVNNYLVSEETIVDFLELLEGVENTTGVEIDIASVASKDDVKSFAVSVRVEGRFAPVMKTIAIIETLPVYIETTSASMDTVLREGNQDEGIWTATLSYLIKKS